MAFRLPRMIVIRSNYYSSRGNFYYREADGAVVLGEPSVFSTLVKVEVERAKSHDRYVHLRFSYSNRYWQRKVNDQFIECVSTKPEEDTSNPACTLFEPVEVPNSNGMFYLTHVQSGGRLLIHDPVNNPTMSLYVNQNPGSAQGYLTFVNWETLVKLPGHVAFKGDNDMFLRGATLDRLPYLQFSSNDPNDRSSGHEVTLMPDGHVRIRSDHFGQLWRLMPNWIRAEPGAVTPDNRDVLFWPVKLDANTIALRSAGNNNFCKRLTADRKTSCLNAELDRITLEARLEVQELVTSRDIYNVRYRMQDARIFDEAPYLAGSTTLFNDKDVEAAVAIAITYEEEFSYSFTRSVSLSAGVTTNISFGLPSIIAGGSIEVSYQVSTTLEWENTTTTKTSVTATGSVPVPPRSTALVSYVGTRGTCNIPFNYTQQDRSSTGGGIVETEQIDGIYTGVNLYNFHFTVERTERVA